MSASDNPAWLEGMVRKRPETAILLQALMLHGIRHGHVSAEDAHSIAVSHPNCRGAAMKLIRRFGFAKDKLIYGTTPASHGHLMWRWVCEDRLKAERAMAALSGALMKSPRKPLKQGVMF